MRRVVPFIGLAVAIAFGVALAPFVGWLSVLIVLAALCVLAWRSRAMLMGVLVLGLLATWPVWLWRHGRTSDAAIVVGLYVLLALWPVVRHPIRTAWVKAFPD